MMILAGLASDDVLDTALVRLCYAAAGENLVDLDEDFHPAVVKATQITVFAQIVNSYFRSSEGADSAISKSPSDGVSPVTSTWRSSPRSGRRTRRQPTSQ